MNIIPVVIGILPFAIATSFTPGPNNLMLAAAGARFGFRRTWRHQSGIVVGFAVMMLCVGSGIVALIASVPSLYIAMKIAGIAYILYLAWQTASSTVAMAEAGTGTPIGFFAAAGFQWINPKAWIMTVTAMTTYTSPGPDQMWQVLLLVLVFAIVGAASSSTWVLTGQFIRRYLTSLRRRIIFNRMMAGLLVVSIIPALIER